MVGDFVIHCDTKSPSVFCYFFERWQKSKEENDWVRVGRRDKMMLCKDYTILESSR